MSIIIDGTAGITFPDTSVQAVTATNASNLSTGTVPKARMYAGAILQVVSASYSTQVSTSSATLATTNLTTSITPSSSTNKVLVLISTCCGYTNAATRQMSFAIFRGSTNLQGSIYAAQLYSNGADLDVPISLSYLDSPATTSSTTYSLYFASTNGGSVNFNQNNNISYITLLEVAA